MIERVSLSRFKCLLTIPALGLALCWPVVSTAAPNPACEPIFNAFTKLVETPNHQYMTQSSPTAALTHGGKLRSSESISTSEASFIKMDTQWRKVPITAQEMLKQQEDARQDAKETCSFLQDDLSEGDAAVYSSHSETGKGTSDLKVWISKANGLPLREEIDLDLGGDTGKTHSTVRFDYDHVEPPKDAK
jgi:hypothetical protein